MNIQTCADYQEMSREGANILLHELRQKPNLLLCAATGSSPTGLYRNLADTCNKTPELFSEMRVLKLDEWGGLDMENPATCEAYLRKYLIRPLSVTAKRYTGFQSNPEDPRKESRRIHDWLNDHGPVDVCILGLGMNGHLALNEPGPFLYPDAHVASLSSRSLTHSMLKLSGKKPSYGLTLGMAEILASRKIIFLISGAGKGPLFRKLMEPKITSELPASLLWLHGDVHCLVDGSTVNVKYP